MNTVNESGIESDDCPKCDYSTPGSWYPQKDSPIERPMWYATRWHKNSIDCHALRAKTLCHSEHLHHYCVKCGYDFVGKVFPK